MKVKDLIELLMEQNPESNVVFHGYEGGYCDVNEITPIKVILNYHDAWYYGPHERVDSIFNENDKNKEQTEVVLIE